MRITGLFSSHIGEDIRHKITMMAGKFPDKWGHSSVSTPVDTSKEKVVTNDHTATSVVEFQATDENSVQIARALFSVGATVLVDGQEVQLAPETPTEEFLPPELLQPVEAEPELIEATPVQPVAPTSFEEKLKGWFSKIAPGGPVN